MIIPSIEWTKKKVMVKKSWRKQTHKAARASLVVNKLSFTHLEKYISFVYPIPLTGSELTIWVSYSLFKGLKHIWLGVEKNSRDIKGFSCCINYFFSRWILEKSQGKAKGRRAIDKLVLFLQKNKLHRDKRKCLKRSVHYTGRKLMQQTEINIPSPKAFIPKAFWILIFHLDCLFTLQIFTTELLSNCSLRLYQYCNSLVPVIGSIFIADIGIKGKYGIQY